MTLKLIQKGLQETEEQCPNCDNYIYIFRDDKGKIQKIVGASLGHKETIHCDRCFSKLKAEAKSE